MILNQCLIIDGHKQGSIVHILPKTEQIALPSEDSKIINGHHKVYYYKVHNFMIDGNYFLVAAKDEFTLSNNEIKKMIFDSKMLSTGERIMENKRHVHADFIIMQANDMSLRFDHKDKRTGEWILCQESPCEFNSNWEYRLHEREFPKTSLSDDEIRNLTNERGAWVSLVALCRFVANAAIKQYILDTEKESK